MPCLFAEKERSIFWSICGQKGCGDFMFKKTILSRIFIINIAAVLIGIITLTTLEFTLVSQYMARERERSLKENAKSVAGIINSGISFNNLQIFLSNFSRSTRTHILIINKRREIELSASAENKINKSVQRVPSEFCSRVLSNEENIEIGTMNGLFTESMFTLQIPTINPADNSVAGAVFISSDMPELQRLNHELLSISAFCMLIVVIVSFILSYMLSKRISKPIKEIGISAKEFAKGNFKRRVKLNADDSSISEIDELALTFNDMAYELEKFEDIRMSFISDVSHELRTPMTTINGFVDGILDETIPPERQKEYLKIVHDEVNRLSRLVNSFLDITRMQSDKLALDLTNFDINEMIRLTVINLERRIEEKAIRVDIEFSAETCMVKADFDSIKRVLTNLLDNAVKFTNQSGIITIRVTVRQQDVWISVRNTGVGIPPEQQRIIFERFYKVDKSRSINKDGTGLGLYIVNNILKAHGRSIRVKSAENEYTEFVFSLPKGKENAKNIEKYSEKLSDGNSGNFVE